MTASRPRRGRGRKTNGPHPTDIAVGARVRERRILLGLSQEALGEKIGLTFQQVQKYERGTNRISSSKLIEIRDALGCTAAELLGEGRAAAGEAERFNRSRRALQLVRNFERIGSKAVQQRMFDMVKACAGAGVGLSAAAE